MQEKEGEFKENIAIRNKEIVRIFKYLVSRERNELEVENADWHRESVCTRKELSIVVLRRQAKKHFTSTFEKYFTRRYSQTIVQRFDLDHVGWNCQNQRRGGSVRLQWIQFRSEKIRLIVNYEIPCFIPTEFQFAPTLKEIEEQRFST